MSTLSPLTKGCFHFDPLISKVFIWILYICLALKRTFSFISFRVSSVKITLLLTKHPMWPYLTHQHKQKKYTLKLHRFTLKQKKYTLKLHRFTLFTHFQFTKTAWFHSIRSDHACYFTNVTFSLLSDHNHSLFTHLPFLFNFTKFSLLLDRITTFLHQIRSRSSRTGKQGIAPLRSS